MTIMPRIATDPLADFLLFRTTDPIEAQESAKAVTAPHRLHVHGRPAEFAAAYHAVEVGRVTLGVIRYGAEVSIDRAGCDDFVAILVPLIGRLTVEARSRQYVASPDGSMVVLSPGQGGAHVRWGSGTAVMALKADTDELARALRWIAPQADNRPFQATYPIVTGWAVQPVLGSAQLFAEVVSRYGRHREVPSPLAKQLREQALANIWLSIPNNHTDAIYGLRRTRVGSRVSQVVDLIAAESCAEYTVPELARAVNVGVRALELAFRRELDETPLHYLQRVRLERAHDELRNLDPSEATVTDIANRWGFGHLGRFAARYRAQYGEMPSETLGAAAR
jgi:AraC-like DNA-binding protein